MSPQEFEQALHDAEVKLARLKALYEQWFQGIERLEPSVARKELDRTIDLLKKSIPRNTALRFRTQQLVARYGTYGIYWGRIARQIEEGTYKRDIVRVTKKRTRAQRREEQQQAWDLDVDVEEVVEDLDGEKTDPGIVVGAPVGAPSPPPKAASSPLAFDEGDLDAILGALAPTPSADESKKPGRSISPFAMGASRPPGAASATFGKPKERAPAPSLAAPLPSTPLPVAAAPRPAGTPAVPPTVARPAAPAVPLPKPAAPAPVAMPRPAAMPPAALKPAPLPPARPAAAAPVPPRPAPPAPAPGDVDEGQMRAIYSRYVDARRQNNERTDVRYEVLAESVKKMMPKLREKHAGKAIDFEIVLQNGKVGLKPKVGG